MSQWYYSESGQQRGPVTEDEIKSLLESRRIHPDTLVWTQGMPDWKAASSIDGLQVSPYAPPASDPTAAIDWSGYEPSGSQVRPWVRYWARTFDFLLFCVVLGGVVMAVWPKVGEMNDTFFGVLLLLGYNFVEPVMLSTIGNTPFKALLRVRVRNNDGTKPSYAKALRRTFAVWIRGQGLGIPLVALITGITSYSRLSNDGVTSWDQDGGFTVTHQTVAWWRWLLLVGLLNRAAERRFLDPTLKGVTRAVTLITHMKKR
ncbi:MAG: RDD family protein [Luteolibacter sp.]